MPHDGEGEKSTHRQSPTNLLGWPGRKQLFKSIRFHQNTEKVQLMVLEIVKKMRSILDAGSDQHRTLSVKLYKLKFAH